MRGDAKNVQDQIGKITSNLKESFNNMRIVKTYNLEILENKRLSKNFDDTRTSSNEISYRTSSS